MAEVGQVQSAATKAQKELQAKIKYLEAEKVELQVRIKDLEAELAKAREAPAIKPRETTQPPRVVRKSTARSPRADSTAPRKTSRKGTTART